MAYDSKYTGAEVEALLDEIGNYPLVSHGTADTTFVLTPNTMHIWAEVSAITLTLGTEESGKVNEYLFQFTSGATATTLTLPSDLVWANGEALAPEANKTYQVSIVNGYAVYSAFPLAVISFSINGTSYKAAVGMTWGEWVGSDWNTDGMFVMNDLITDGYDNAVVLNGAPVRVNDLIIDNTDYQLVP